jgi:hypothetical protein
MSTEPTAPAKASAPLAFFPLLLTQQAAARYLGISGALFYEAAEADPSFPQPVLVPSRKGRSRRKYRREDLRTWVRGLTGVDRG